MMPIYTGMMVVAEPLVMVLFGKKWIDAIPFLHLLPILGIFYSIGNPIGNLLLAKGRADVGFYLNIVVFVLYGIAVYFGATYGINAIIIALILVQLFILFPLDIFIRWKLIGMKLLPYLNAIFPSLFSSLIMAFCIMIIRFAIGPIFPLFDLIITITIGSLIYVPMVFLIDKPFLIGLYKLYRSKEGI
jgi:O-antigen/teichoic acid export membrane protein